MVMVGVSITIRVRFMARVTSLAIPSIQSSPHSSETVPIKNFSHFVTNALFCQTNVNMNFM